MKWGMFTTLFGVSMIKFMFAPFGGPAAELTFIETYLDCCAGAIFSSAIFFYSASYFMRRAVANLEKKNKALITKGLPVPVKKRFTRVNKFVIRMKRSIGIIGITFWAPFFLSIPLGSIIAAKFYGHKKQAYPLIVLGIFLNGLVTTSFAYLFFK
ncbi:MAG: hypothetical protein QNL36_11950 [Crocinitomicaceae bacterium]|jgi:hypothetical protein|nr:hypothetical protein [Crocinitomicaceae bacterium]MDC1384429.1 hypothetical protein [Crocinitomicaceae bacterium]|tara:strand:- start:21964 stop:22428 length:465 start_codon:yes stop_codon:yes gene_type:complete